jgi:predicted Zn-ribbon and HTH transcriptional regulator
VSVKPTRPFRDHEVYAADCIDCHEEIESDTADIPLRCPECAAKKKAASE